MKFSRNTTLDYILNDLFGRYRAAVPAVDAITQALIERKAISSQYDIVNDHIAFRTMGVPCLGISSLEKIFLHHGYQKKDSYYFEGKKLKAWWYAPQAPEYPRIFLSELDVSSLPDAVQAIIRRYTDAIHTDPVEHLNLDNGDEVARFLHTPLWQVPSLSDYTALLAESEYAAWVIYNQYYLNHYTISIHALPDGYNTLPAFNEFVESLGIRLNDSGGQIKTSADGLLRQSSTVANKLEAVFAGGEKRLVAGSYVEFAERRVLPVFAHLAASDIQASHRREGFETNNADKIFESTYSSQTR